MACFIAGFERQALGIIKHSSILEGVRQEISQNVLHNWPTLPKFWAVHFNLSVDHKIALRLWYFDIN